MRRRIALRKHFVRNHGRRGFRFAPALGVRARTRAALVQRIVIARQVLRVAALFREQVRRPSLLIRLVPLGNILRGLAQ